LQIVKVGVVFAPAVAAVVAIVTLANIGRAQVSSSYLITVGVPLGGVAPCLDSGDKYAAQRELIDTASAAREKKSADP
jgi:hypothetical protein